MSEVSMWRGRRADTQVCPYLLTHSFLTFFLFITHLWRQKLMDNVTRTQKIESYGKASEQLDQALKGLPPEMWQFKPAPQEWSIHEIIIHLADSEANSYVRCRRFIAEPGKEVMAYNEGLWAVRLGYHDQDVDEALALFKMLRQSSYKLIKRLPDSVWSNTVTHPEHGVLTFDDWLTIYEAHIPEHIEQMKKNYEAWKKVSKG